MADADGNRFQRLGSAKGGYRSPGCPPKKGGWVKNSIRRLKTFENSSACESLSVIAVGNRGNPPRKGHIRFRMGQIWIAPIVDEEAS